MKKLILPLLLLSVVTVSAQSITQPPSGDNQKARVSQWIGPVEVSIQYNSPDVHGPNGEDRKGHIWGELVHYGFADQGFGTSKAAPWRAGANENTTITFSHDVKVNGKDLKAGTYGLFLDVEKEGPWNWIFSNNSGSWGSYFYNAAEDALRVTTIPQDSPYTEYLTYGFDDRLPASAVAFLQWENKRIPFRIEVANVNDHYIAKIGNELRNNTGFDYQNWVAAAQFCVQNKTHLTEALRWADYAISGPFIGQENFSTLKTKADVLTALNRNDEADELMTKAIRKGDATVMAVHQYGRSLLAAGRKDKALEVFQFNAKSHPEEKFTTFVGLARVQTAMGNKKEAIKNWEVALKNLPADQKQNQPAYEAELKKLKDGK